MNSCNSFWIYVLSVYLLFHYVDSKSFDCNFSHTYCEWKVLNGWSRYIDKGGIGSKSDPSDLLSPRHKPTTGSCLIISFEGGDTTMFSVIIEKEGEPPETLYQIDDGYYYEKVKGHLTIQSRKFFKIRLHADVIYGEYDTETYLYGVTLKEAACSDTVYDCDFEDKDICGYQNTNQYEGSWKRKNENSSFSKESHPKYDHTSGPYGSYLYVSEKDMHWDDSFKSYHLTAEISSKDIPKGNYCITIWYQIHGKAKLHLSCETYFYNKYDNEIKSSYGSGVWNAFQFQVKVQYADFKLMLKGKLTSSVSNWIAVDDIDVNTGSCPATGFCEFTNNLCTWSNVYYKEKWMVATSETTSKRRDGPLYDVNSKGGYAYFRKHIDDSKAKFSTARLMSVNIDSSKYKCFKFRYYLPKNIGSLSIITADIEGKETIRWTLHGKQKQDWQQGTVPLSTRNGYVNMNLMIQGKLYTTSNETIAVDNVGFFTDSCDFKPSMANPDTLKTTASPMESTTNRLPHSWKTFDCDFNHRLCEWTRKRGWKKYFGKRGLSSNGVVSDLISPEHGSTNGACLTVSFKAGDVAIFSIIIEQDEESPRLLYEVGLYNYYILRKEYITIQSRNTFKIKLHAAARYSSWDWKSTKLFGISLKEAACRDTVYDCDFEDNDLCGYVNQNTYRGPWKIKNENSSFSAESHPAYDHTFGTYGSFLYVSRKELRWYNHPEDLKVTIKSKYIKAGKYCVTIWYQIYGKAELHLLGRSSHDHKTHKLTSSYGSSVWNAFQFPVKYYYQFTLSLEGIITSSDSNWIAVDDVDVNYGDCSPPGSCNFSTNLCTWSNMFYKEKWIVADSKQVDTRNAGIVVNGNTSGGYAFFRKHIDDSNTKSATARLMSLEMDSSKYKCFKFRYYPSENRGSLSIITADFERKETVRWTLHGKQKHHWQQGTVPLSTGKASGKINLIIQGKLYATSNQSIAVDDVEFSTDSCDLTPTIANPIIQVTTVVPLESTTERSTVPSKSFDCDFNHRVCEWKRNYGWSNYIDKGGISWQNDLMSPEHEPTNGSCLVISFKSGDGAILSVVIEKTEGSSKTVYQVGIRSSYRYRKEYITVESSKFFKIRLHATTYSSWHSSNTILYRVTMKEAACSDTAYDCDFEDEDTCGYLNTNTYTGSWKRRNENSSFSTESHPKYDHTLGTYGSYLYLSRKEIHWNHYGYPKSSQVSIKSQYVKAGRYCVTIWYQIYGEAVLKLLCRSYRHHKAHKFKSSYGNGVWNAFQFPVNFDYRFRLFLKGTFTSRNPNWIAIDDIDINHGECSPPGFCDFSTNLCTWSNMFYKDKWMVIESKTADKWTSGPVPAEKATGGYVYFRKHLYGISTKSIMARLMSVNIDSSIYKCFKFRYYMQESIGSLSIIIADFEGNEKVRWTLHGKQKQEWQPGTLPLSTGRTNGKIHLIIQAKLYPSSNKSIAVDDVAFLTNSCDLKPTSADPDIQVTTVMPLESTTERHTMLQTTSETALPKTETTKKYNSATTSNSPTSHTPRQTHSITTTSLPTTSQTAKQTQSTTTTTAFTTFKTPKRTPKTKTTNILASETSKQSLSTATMKNSPTTSETPKRTPSKTTASLRTKSQTAKQTPSTTTTTASTTFKTPKRTPKTKTTNISTYETSKQRLSTATMKNSPTTSQTPKRRYTTTTFNSLITSHSPKLTATASTPNTPYSSKMTKETHSSTTTNSPSMSQTSKLTPSETTLISTTTSQTSERTYSISTTNIYSTSHTTKRTPNTNKTNLPGTSGTPMRTPRESKTVSPITSQTTKQTSTSTSTISPTTFKTPKRASKTIAINTPSTSETSVRPPSTKIISNSPTSSQTPKQTDKATTQKISYSFETTKRTPSKTTTNYATTSLTPEQRSGATKTTDSKITKGIPSSHATPNLTTTSQTPEFFTSVEITEPSTTQEKYKHTTSKMPMTGISKTLSTSETTGKTDATAKNTKTSRVSFNTKKAVSTSGTKSTKEFARTTPQVSNNVVFVTTKGWKGEEAKSRGSQNAEKSKATLGGPAGISGIVIGVLAITLTVTVAIFIHRRRRIRKLQEEILTTGNRFENPLFEVEDATFSQSQA